MRALLIPLCVWLVPAGEKPQANYDVVYCPFVLGEPDVIMTDRGPVDVGGVWYCLEPAGVPCPGHMVEVSR